MTLPVKIPARKKGVMCVNTNYMLSERQFLVMNYCPGLEHHKASVSSLFSHQSACFSQWDYPACLNVCSQGDGFWEDSSVNQTEKLHLSSQHC